MPTDTCAFLPCDQVTECCLPGGCITKRFGKMGGKNAATQDTLRDNAPALNGTKPGRTNRDPALIKRKRKPLQP